MQTLDFFEWHDNLNYISEFLLPFLEDEFYDSDVALTLTKDKHLMNGIILSFKQAVLKYIDYAKNGKYFILFYYSSIVEQFNFSSDFRDLCNQHNMIDFLIENFLFNEYFSFELMFYDQFEIFEPENIQIFIIDTYLLILACLSNYLSSKAYYPSQQLVNKFAQKIEQISDLPRSENQYEIYLRLSNVLLFMNIKSIDLNLNFILMQLFQDVFFTLKELEKYPEAQQLECERIMALNFVVIRLFERLDKNLIDIVKYRNDFYDFLQTFHPEFHGLILECIIHILNHENIENISSDDQFLVKLEYLDSKQYSEELKPTINTILLKVCDILTSKKKRDLFKNQLQNTQNKKSKYQNFL